MIIDLGKIIISNTRSKVLDRVKDGCPDGVWVDTFILNMKDI